MHRQQKGADHRKADRLEILDGTIGQVFVQIGRDGEAAGDADQQRIAVRLGARYELGADDAASTRAIVDHHLLIESFSQFLSDQACNDICPATGRLGHDQAYGFDGVGLCECSAGNQQYCRTVQQSVF